MPEGCRGGFFKADLKVSIVVAFLMGSGNEIQKISRRLVQMQEIRKISRSRVVDGVETKSGNVVRNASFDW